MVYISAEDGSVKKFACLTCIRGHRSSKCNHPNRKLFEIKKKGRPVSQCDNCRQLRKTKQIHIKCICHTKKDSPLKEVYKHSAIDSQSTTCKSCHCLSSFCTCKDKNTDELDYLSSSSSDGSITPTTSYPLYPAGLVYSTNSTSQTSSHRPLVPIHDPTDDIDSDTPIYKLQENTIPDRTAVLGEFTNTTSEELMNQIYSGFILHE